MIEHEKKILLTEDEYTCVLNGGYNFGDEEIHINHYYDTDSFTYNALGITCRIREKDGGYVATVKQHGEAETANERSSSVENENDDSFFCGMNVQCFGLMKTKRREAIPFKGIKVVLDHNEYLDTIDYELEIEYEVGYEKLASALIEATADILFHSGLTERRTSIISRANTAPNKSQRFFKRFFELEAGRPFVSCKEQVHEFGDLAHGYIDVQSGILKLVLEGVDLQDTKSALNVKFIYNGDSEEDFSNCYKIGHLRGLSKFYKAKLGRRWRLDLMQTMVAEKITYGGVEYDGYVLTNENGKKSYFILKPNLGLNDEEYEEYIDVSDESRKYDDIERKLYADGITYWFDGNGRLYRIWYDDKNCLDITHIGDRIIGVSDTNGKELFINYNLRAQIKTITTTDNSKVVCSYDSSSGMLNGVVYPNGNRILLTYDDGNISCIEMLDADKKGIYKVKYSYNGNKVIKVEEFFFDENGEYRSSVVSNYIYSESENKTVAYITEMSYLGTKERTSTTSKFIYNFSKNGKMISCYVYPGETGECEE